MKPKPETLEKSDRGFDSQTFWRHYVATVDTDHEWDEERPQQGRGSNRLFLFLLLFHIFLIGSVVLYNLVSERPKPVFVDNSSPSKVSATRKAPPSVTQAPGSHVITAGKEAETLDHRVAQGDSLKSIADASGVAQEEIARLNHINVNTQLAVGSVLRVPKSKARASVTVIPAGAQPSHVETKIVSVQATTAPATAKMFAPVAPAPSPRKAETVVSKLPEEKVKSKVEDAPPAALKPKVTAKVEDSPPPAKPRPAEKVEEAPPAAKPKPTEAKAIARTESPPAHAAKASETPKSEPAKPSTSASTSKPAASGATHTVKPKETFYSISRKLGVKVEDLMRVNGVTDPGKLREGAVLKVPAK